MKRILELNLGALILLTVAVGCGGNSTSDAGAGGASSNAGNPGGPNGGAPATPSGGAHSGGQTSNPGSAGASTGGGFMTNVPGTTPLKDLTPDQVAQLCSDLGGFLTASLGDLGCKAQALAAAAQATTDAAAQSTCKSTLAACKPDTTQDGECDTTCPATIADAAVCFNDTGAAFKALGAAIPPCDGLTMAQAKAAIEAFGSTDSGFKQPESCMKLDMECPGSMSGM
jgi:hypothetical protein